MDGILRMFALNLANHIDMTAYRFIAHHARYPGRTGRDSRDPLCQSVLVVLDMERIGPEFGLGIFLPHFDQFAFHDIPSLCSIVLL